MVERRPPKPEVEGSSPSSPAENIMRFLKTYFDDVKIELRKVTWLSKNEMIGSTMVVWIFAIIVAIFLFVVDFGIAEFISRLLGGK